jgi:hypothetical protein
LNLSSGILVSKFAFKFNVHRYMTGNNFSIDSASIITNADDITVRGLYNLKPVDPLSLKAPGLKAPRGFKLLSAWFQASKRLVSSLKAPGFNP